MELVQWTPGVLPERHPVKHAGALRLLLQALHFSGCARSPNIRDAFTSGWPQDHPRATFEKLPRSVPEVYLKCT